MKKAQRIERKQAHAEAYKQGWDDCERFYAGVLAKLLKEDKREKGEDDPMKAKIWLEHGVIKCCSQMCLLPDSTCPRFHLCENVEIEINKDGQE